MKIAIIGAAGKAGRRLTDEALRRGHEVTGIVRDPSKLAARPGLTVAAGDVDRPEALAKALTGHDAVISAVMFTAADPANILKAVRASGVKRYLAVGGAGSLEVAPGTLLVDTPEFPAPYLAEARGGKAYLDLLRGADDLDWTMLSPSAYFFEGERTGTFRLGGDQLLVDAAGKSAVSYEDFAVALIDEIETPRHVKGRFTVGY